MSSLIYTTFQLPTTTQTVSPSNTITTPLEWFNQHYTNQEGIDELKEDPTLKDVIYEYAFDMYKLGRASALTVVLFLLLLFVSILQLWLARKQHEKW